jgi:hypothetical protein
MPKKQLISKSGDTWEWEETPETVKALKDLHISALRVNETKSKKTRG